MNGEGFEGSVETHPEELETPESFEVDTVSLDETPWYGSAAQAIYGKNPIGTVSGTLPVKTRRRNGAVEVEVLEGQSSYDGPIWVNTNTL